MYRCFWKRYWFSKQIDAATVLKTKVKMNSFENFEEQDFGTDFVFESDPHSLARILDNRELSPRSVLAMRMSTKVQNQPTLSPAKGAPQHVRDNPEKYDFFQSKKGDVFWRPKTPRGHRAGQQPPQRQRALGRVKVDALPQRQIVHVSKIASEASFKKQKGFLSIFVIFCHFCSVISVNFVISVTFCHFFVILSILSFFAIFDFFLSFFVISFLSILSIVIFVNFVIFCQLCHFCTVRHFCYFLLSCHFSQFCQFFSQFEPIYFIASETSLKNEENCFHEFFLLNNFWILSR